MPSPFPGMNPYLEQDEAWHDFHERFIPLAAEVIGSQVLPRYIVKIEEQIFIHELGENSGQFLGRADMALAPGRTDPVGTRGTVVMAAPAQVLLPVVDIERLSYLEIRDRQNRQLITVLELLSPSNKRPSRHRDQYEAKRNQLLTSSANFVEIDLLRGGQRLPLTNFPECDYYVLVSRVEERPRAGICPIPLRERLPIIPVPLRKGDVDAALDLQFVLNRIYDSAGYEIYIYAGHPDPPLAPEDAPWAQQWLPQLR